MSMAILGAVQPASVLLSESVLRRPDWYDVVETLEPFAIRYSSCYFLYAYPLS